MNYQLRLSPYSFPSAETSPNEGHCGPGKELMDHRPAQTPVKAEAHAELGQPLLALDGLADNGTWGLSDPSTNASLWSIPQHGLYGSATSLEGNGENGIMPQPFQKHSRSVRRAKRRAAARAAAHVQPNPPVHSNQQTPGTKTRGARRRERLAAQKAELEFLRGLVHGQKVDLKLPGITIKGGTVMRAARVSNDEQPAASPKACKKGSSKTEPKKNGRSPYMSTIRPGGNTKRLDRSTTGANCTELNGNRLKQQSIVAVKESLAFRNEEKLTLDGLLDHYRTPSPPNGALLQTDCRGFHPDRMAMLLQAQNSQDDLPPGNGEVLVDASEVPSAINEILEKDHFTMPKLEDVQLSLSENPIGRPEETGEHAFEFESGRPNIALTTDPGPPVSIPKGGFNGALDKQASPEARSDQVGGFVELDKGDEGIEPGAIRHADETVSYFPVTPCWQEAMQDHLDESQISHHTVELGDKTRNAYNCSYRSDSFGDCRMHG